MTEAGIIDPTKVERVAVQNAASIASLLLTTEAIITDLADLQCRTGRAQRGLEQLQEARPMMAERYPDDPWRVALVDSVHAGCLTQLGSYAAAAALIESSTPTILARWKPDSLYGYDSLQRAISLYERTGDQVQAGRYRGLRSRRPNLGATDRL